MAIEADFKFQVVDPIMYVARGYSSVTDISDDFDGPAVNFGTGDWNDEQLATAGVTPEDGKVTYDQVSEMVEYTLNFGPTCPSRDVRGRIIPPESASTPTGLRHFGIHGNIFIKNITLLDASAEAIAEEAAAEIRIRTAAKHAKAMQQYKEVVGVDQNSPSWLKLAAPYLPVVLQSLAAALGNQRVGNPIIPLQRPQEGDKT